EGALRDLDEAIRLKPDFPEAYNNRGHARGNKGDLEGALRDLDEAIRGKPDFASAYYNRALIWQATKEFVSAIGDYERDLALGGGIPYGDHAEVERRIKSLGKIASDS